MPRAKLADNFCRPISCIFLAEAAKIELHARAGEVKLTVRKNYLVEANEGQYSVDRLLVG